MNGKKNEKSKFLSSHSSQGCLILRSILRLGKRLNKTTQAWWVKCCQTSLTTYRYLLLVLNFVKIDIENIWIRYEDWESNPNQPFCMGVTIKKLSTYTANDLWEREFITKQDICRKLLTLENLSIFLNFSDDLFYEELTKDYSEEFLDEKQKLGIGESWNIYKALSNKNENEKDRLLQIFKYKYFISEENQRNLHNSFLIYNFCVESRLILNKNPEANSKPQIELDLMLGGKGYNFM